MSDSVELAARYPEAPRPPHHFFSSRTTWSWIRAPSTSFPLTRDRKQKIVQRELISREHRARAMPLCVYTAQRECYRGRDLLDLTIVTALSRAFICENITTCAPARMSAERARAVYLAFLRRSYRAQRSTWQYILTRPRLVIVCACPPGTRACRRYMLADVFGKLGACLGGELRHSDQPSSTTRTYRRPS